MNHLKAHPFPDPVEGHALLVFDLVVATHFNETLFDPMNKFFAAGNRWVTKDSEGEIYYLDEYFVDPDADWNQKPPTGHF